ncbi:hypothetical protein CPB83DRAFT_831902 [Crepidotus variabilis]|uniref:Uncharacterized protein n=1 Tax=Crepidotus variabilis TaxID=179855 RepID=A0A9P6JUF4_9AGAR|nr:hypothetical protein CPB83DRAFT_831902 [Crepidotus variabilis]
MLSSLGLWLVAPPVRRASSPFGGSYHLVTCLAQEPCGNRWGEKQFKSRLVVRDRVEHAVFASSVSNLDVRSTKLDPFKSLSSAATLITVPSHQFHELPYRTSFANIPQRLQHLLVALIPPLRSIRRFEPPLLLFAGSLGVHPTTFGYYPNIYSGLSFHYWVAIHSSTISSSTTAISTATSSLTNAFGYFEINLQILTGPPVSYQYIDHLVCEMIIDPPRGSIRIYDVSYAPAMSIACDGLANVSFLDLDAGSDQMDQRQDSRRSRTVQVAGYGKKKLSKFEVRLVDRVEAVTAAAGAQVHAQGTINNLSSSGEVLLRTSSQIGIAIQA